METENKLRLSEILKEKIEEWIGERSHSEIYAGHIVEGASFALDELTVDVAVKFADWLTGCKTRMLKELDKNDPNNKEEYKRIVALTTTELFTEFITNHYRPPLNPELIERIKALKPSLPPNANTDDFYRTT